MHYLLYDQHTTLPSLILVNDGPPNRSWYSNLMPADDKNKPFIVREDLLDVIMELSVTKLFRKEMPERLILTVVNPSDKFYLTAVRSALEGAGIVCYESREAAESAQLDTYIFDVRGLRYDSDFKPESTMLRIPATSSEEAFRLALQQVNKGKLRRLDLFDVAPGLDKPKT